MNNQTKLENVNYRTFLEGSSDPIFCFTPEGQYQFVNSAFAAGVGRTVEEIIGKKIWDVFPKVEADKRYAVVKWVFKHKKVRNIEVQIPRADGIRSYLTSAKPIIDVKGNVDAVICTSKDITELKRNQEALQRNSEIQIALREIADLAVQAVSIEALYAKIHLATKGIVTAPNFYIALLNESTRQIVMPYCSDELFAITRLRPISNGIVEYVMRLGHVLNLTPSELQRIKDSGRIGLLEESASYSFLGAPLKDSMGNSIGVIAVNDLEAYRPADAEVFSIIAAQISLAINRKQSEAALLRYQEKLEQRVEETTRELSLAYQEMTLQNEQLKATHAILHRSIKIQSILREIAETAVSAGSLEELFSVVHRLVENVVLTRDFYFSIYEPEKNQIVFPYCKDETGTIVQQRPVGKGLTEYLMRTGRFLHLTPEDLVQLVREGEVSAEMVPTISWTGVPLIDTQGRPFGAMGMDSETNARDKEYYEQNRQLLMGIAAQVSLAIERKRSEEMARKAQKNLLKEQELTKAFYESVPGMLYLYDDEGRLVKWNKQHETMTGYSSAELSRMKMFDWFKGDEAAIARIETGLERAFVEGYATTEADLQIKGGVRLPMLFTAVPLNFAKKMYFGGIGIDITEIRKAETERVLREQEMRRDVQLATRVQSALLSAPTSSNYLQIDTIYRPAGYVGGDLYFMDWRYDGKLLRGFLLDAAGQGLATALHTASLHVLLREVNEQDVPLSNAIRWLNGRASEYFDEGVCTNALGFELDLETRELCWVSAGISEFWIATQTKEGKVECTGMPFGAVRTEPFITHKLAIQVGDSIYFPTAFLSGRLAALPCFSLERYSEMVHMLEELAKDENNREDASAICIHVQTLPQSPVLHDGWPRTIRFESYGDYQRLKGEVGKILSEVTGLAHSMHEVAIHEALANAMECRDGVPRQHKARIYFNKRGNRLIVRVKTSRIGFAGNAILRRLRSQPEDMFAFGADSSMGRGIPMMLSMSHKMTYNSEGTELLLAWKLDKRV